jgi:COP9 signalosome complex subunit 3
MVSQTDLKGLTKVIAAPGSACSAIQVEAYKKFILINLILNGHPTSIPSIVSIPAARAYKYLTKPYEEFARSLTTNEQLEACLQRHQEVYREDKNMGLIAQVIERQEMRRIDALQKIYVAISLEDIARKLDPANQDPTSTDIRRIESLIVRMVDP